MMIFFTVGARSGRYWSDDDTPLKRTYIVEATDYGLQKMNELVNVQEPHLYQIGMTHLSDSCSKSAVLRTRGSVPPPKEGFKLAYYNYPI
jgi:hypothetical protein